jgi:hypothetical protein
LALVGRLEKCLSRQHGRRRAWQDAHDDLPDTLCSIGIAPSGPNTVYVGTVDGHLYRSDTGGG